MHGKISLMGMMKQSALSVMMNQMAIKTRQTFALLKSLTLA
jgi:hypothetical protein